MADDWNLDRRLTAIEVDQKTSSLDPPATPCAKVSSTENSPSKRKIAVYEPERTPCRTAPNSGRKRRPAHALSRATPTPSHGVKMSGIFHDAALSLEACYTNPSTSTPNMKTFSLPIRQARGPFGHSGGQDRLVSPQFRDSPKLDSTPASGWRALTPPAIPYGPAFPTPLPVRPSPCQCPNTLIGGEEANESGESHLAQPIISDSRKDVSTGTVTYPKLNQWTMRGFSSVASSLSSDCHSSHGVPVVIPIPSKSHDKVEVIDTWLSEVYEPDTAQPPDDKPYTPQSPYHVPRTPESPDHQSYCPLPPYTLREQGSPSKQNFQRSPKRPFTSLGSPLHPQVVLPEHVQAGTMSASSSTMESSHPVYPILPGTGAIPLSIYRCATPSPPQNYSITSPRNLFSFPKFRPLVPSLTSGAHPSSISSLGPSIPSDTGNRRRKRRRVRSPSDIPIFARSARRLSLTNFSNEDVAPVKELSPHVERYRKGYGPQPERRPSYWDRDILGARANGEGQGDEGTVDENKDTEQFWNDIGDERKVMGGGERSEELTRATTLVGGVENAKSGLGV